MPRLHRGRAPFLLSASDSVDTSIIIVTRNTCLLTSAAIRSVLESSDQLSKEIILVDNGSTDDTAKTIPNEFPAVKYLRSEHNLGFGRANNLGAKAAQGQLLLLLNSDARLKLDSLGQAAGWMRDHPDCGVAGAQLLNADGSRQHSIANFPSLATELLNKSLLRRIFPKRFPGKEQPHERPLEVETIIGAFFLTRREVWDALGGFDEDYFFFFEETDLCLRARRQGWKVHHLPLVQVWHEQGKTANQWPAAARIEYWRSRYTYFRKHHSPMVFLILRIGLWLRLAGNFMASLLMSLLSLGRSARCNRKLAVHSALLWWHCQGRPEGVGLPRR